MQSEFNYVISLPKFQGMNNRIALVLKTKDISPSQLADELGVQRSGISHIMNGRNKPSLEFVQKLIRLYPDISMQWILFGEGPMMNPYPGIAGPAEVVSSEKPKPRMMELFSMDDDSATNGVTPEKEKEPETLPKPIENQDIKSSSGESEKEAGKIEEQPIILEIAAEAETVTEKRRERPMEVPEKPNPKKNPEQPEKSVRKISRIMVFYNDRTFVEYQPGEE